MPYQDRAKQLASQARHYQQNKAKYQEHARKRKMEVRAWLREYKSGLQCECGEDRPAALTFHHLDPKEKELNIAAAVSNRWSKERILTEIAKCKVMCANCHLCLHDEDE